MNDQGQWCADAQIPELTTLAETIETWWPAIEVFLTTGYSGDDRHTRRIDMLTAYERDGVLPPLP